MQIGSLKIEGYACLAPMAGVADRAMREMCRGYGAAYVVGELASAKGISLGDKKSAELLSVSDIERPMGTQLFGDDPVVMAKAAQRAMAYSPDFIDINMGCPAPKVVGNGGGSALMKDPALAGRIVKEVSRAVSVPVTVKIRSGWDDNSINAVELALICEENGAKAITVHGRTRKQMYAPPVNLDIITAVKKAVRVRVIGNGDIDSASDAASMYETTGCDFVMVGRGAQGNPFLFRQINAYLGQGVTLPDATVNEKMLALLRQVKMMLEYKGERTAMCEARKHAAWYMKGIHHAAAYRRECGSLTKYEQLEELCYRFCKENDENQETDAR
ncbi:MAG: tRNA dihydrouridine synthase DusB [Clostridiales bacterium 43-6]|nr:MAG: tRNA dihydrouridine synthase DusB [Clostridiales bacterium 43-6]